MDIIGADLAALRPEKYEAAGRVVTHKGACPLCGAPDGACTSEHYQEAQDMAAKKEAAAAKKATSEAAAARAVKQSKAAPEPLPDDLEWVDEQAGTVRVTRDITASTVRAGYKTPTTIQVLPAGRVTTRAEVDRLRGLYADDGQQTGDKRAEATAETK